MYCSIWSKILTGFYSQRESAPSHNINWDHFDISALTELSLESYRLFIQELKLSLNVNDDSEKILIY